MLAYTHRKQLYIVLTNVTKGYIYTLKADKVDVEGGKPFEKTVNFENERLGAGLVEGCLQRVVSVVSEGVNTYAVHAGAENQVRSVIT